MESIKSEPVDSYLEDQEDRVDGNEHLGEENNMPQFAFVNVESKRIEDNIAADIINNDPLYIQESSDIEIQLKQKESSEDWLLNPDILPGDFSSCLEILLSSEGSYSSSNYNSVEAEEIDVEELDTQECVSKSRTRNHRKKSFDIKPTSKIEDNINRGTPTNDFEIKGNGKEEAVGVRGKECSNGGKNKRRTGVKRRRGSLKTSFVQGKQTHIDKKNFKCNQCGKAFKQNSHVTVHMRQHTGEKPYICNECKKAFADRTTLISHLRTHTGEMPFQCNQCGKAFKQIAALTNHMRLHTGEKPFYCNVCSKSFADRSTLNSHMRTHTDEKPFACNECGKGFRKKSHLSVHRRRHTGEKPFKCSVCNKAFPHKSTITTHMATHTGKKCL